jgi:hypothetical protein
MIERPPASSLKHLCFAWSAWLLVTLRALVRVQLLLLKGHVSRGLRKGLLSG